MENTLSIFVDESGDFGKYENHEPYYIFSLVFHDQSISIDHNISILEEYLFNNGFERTHCFHAGPIIRREEDYQYLTIDERRKLFNRMFLFSKNCGISFCSFITEKKKCQDSVQLTIDLSKKLALFIMNNHDTLSKYDKVIVYYDNGQIELSRVLASVFSALLPVVEFRKVQPSNYRLFQVADLLCSLKLTQAKYDNSCLSNTEKIFFGTQREFKKNYGKYLEKMEFR